MNRVKRRAFILAVLVLILVGGVVFYLHSYAAEAPFWVAYPSNKHMYQNGQPTLGNILDRNGEILAQTVDGKRIYNEDETVRRALLHIIGDNSGKIGTGAQTKFAGQLTGFSFVSGLFNIGSGGKDLTLTVDAKISRAALETMGNYRGAVFMYNYKTGATLCAVSSPNYDPMNVPADLETNSAYEGAYINRCFGALYTPGSVMKVVTSAAAIENLPDIEKMTFHCTGSCIVDGKKINCQKVHGTIDFKTALAKSCNCAFAEISQLLGADTLVQYFNQMGLAESMNISGIYTPSGKIDNWANNPSELAWAGIGQSTDLATPAALARMMGAIANGGVAVEPRLVLSNQITSKTLLSESTAATLTRMLRNDTETVYGDSSFPKELAGCVCAKSGTAQVDGKESNSWFCGFCTGDYPCAFAVVVEEGGAGSGIAKDVAAAALAEIVKN